MKRDHKDSKGRRKDSSDREVTRQHDSSLNKVVFDYKNVEILRRFVTETWQMTPARVNGNNAKQQRKIKIAIERARFLALIPYTDQHR